MRETQMFPDYRPVLHKPRLAAPALHERDGLHVYDSELGGTVPVKKPCGEMVPDTRRSKFSQPI